MSMNRGYHSGQAALLAVLAGVAIAGMAYSQPTVEPADAAADSAPVERLTLTVSNLAQISNERRKYYASNPDGKTPEELNDELPEIRSVELRNDASSAVSGETLRVIAWNTERGGHWADCASLVGTHPAMRDADII